MKELSLKNPRSTATGPFGPQLAIVLSQLEGRKTWPNGNTLSFETTEFNISALRQTWPNATVVDDRQKQTEAVSAFDFGQGIVKKGFVLNEAFELDNNDFQSVVPSEWVKRFKTKPYGAYQVACFEKLKDLPGGAIFSEQGTGKTKSMIDIICYKRVQETIDAVLILSWPKGVHKQWVDDQFPAHSWEGVEYAGCAWNGKAVPDWVWQPNKKLKVFSLNIETTVHKKTLEFIERFIAIHGQRALIVVDESQSIKNKQSKRWQNLAMAATPTFNRFVMTGTPIAKDLLDEWAQFSFVDERIIGIRYMTAFRQQFCVMGGFENRQIIAHRNIKTFKTLTSPYIFRATKKELDLPEKVFDPVKFDLTTEQKGLIKDLKENLSAEIESGVITSAGSAVASIVRMQQVSNGFIVDDDGEVHFLKANPRLEALDIVISGSTSKVVIWCRFREDVKAIEKAYGDEAVTYYGGTSKRDRPENLDAFKNPEHPAKYLIASPAAAGSGIDGLQKVASRAVYYSNSYNAIDRWQSEDRIHRIGMGDQPAIYHDLIARGGIDQALINNIKKKKSLSDFVLDDVKGFLNEIE